MQMQRHGLTRLKKPWALAWEPLTTCPACQL